MFSNLKVDSAEENKTRKKVDNAQENKTRKKNLAISNQHVSTISWSCFKSVKSKSIYFLTGTCSSTFKNYFVIAHLGKKFTIEAQQILDLPIRKRKLRKRWKKRHRAQRKLHKRWKNRHRAQRKLRKSWKKRHSAQRKLRICATPTSGLSYHTSRSSITSIISIGWSPQRFHPRSSV